MPGKREAKDEILMEERRLDEGLTQKLKSVKRSGFDLRGHSFLKPNGLFVPMKRTSMLRGELNWIHDRHEKSEHENKEFGEHLKGLEGKLERNILQKIALTDFWASRGKKESVTPQ